MKKLMKVLSMMLCLALLMSGTPADMLLTAYSEGDEFVAEVAEQEAAPVEEIAPVEEAAPMEEPAQEETHIVESPETVEDSWEPAAPDFADSQEPSSEDAALDVDSAPAEDVDAIDYSATAAVSKAFTHGFVEVLAGGALVFENENASADLKVELSAGVVYALTRADGDADRLMIAFNAGSKRGIDTGWVSADRVRPMEPTVEVPAYIAYCSDFEGLLYYNDSAELPLVRIGCTYAEAEPEQTAAPEQSEGGSNAQTEEPSDPTEQGHPVVAPAEPESGEADEADSEIDTMLPELDEPLIDVEDVIPSIEEDRIDLHPGDTAQLNLELPEDELALLTSDNIKVATVSQSGMVTAIAPGSATVTLTVGDVQDTVEIAVTAAPADIAETAMSAEVDGTFRLRSSSITLGVGDTFQISDGSDGIIEVVSGSAPYGYGYKSSTTAYATVSSSGLITAKKKGTATITIGAKKADGGYITPYMKLTVKVKAATTSVKLSSSAMTLGAGMTDSLTVGFSSSSTYGDFTFENNNTGVLKVTRNGNKLDLKALNPGTATITVRTTRKDYVDTCAITVVRAPKNEEIVFNVPEEIGVGEKNMSVSATYPSDAMATITYASGDPNKITVDATTGALSAKAPGSTTISVLMNGKVVGSKPITILNYPTGISLKPGTSSIKLEVGRTYQISDGPDGIISVADGTRGSYAYKSSDKKVATVSSAGLVTGKKTGTATITIGIAQNTKKTVKLTVKVVKAGSTFAVNPASATLNIGDEQTLTIANGSDPDYTVAFEQEGNSVRIDGNTAKAIAPGTTTIWAVATSNTPGVDPVRTVSAATITVLPSPTDEDIVFSDATPTRISPNQPNCYVTATCINGTGSAFEYRLVSPFNGVGLDKTTGKLTYTGTATKGSFTVMATAVSGGASRTMEVSIAPSGTISGLSKKSLTLGVGGTYQITDGADGIIQLNPVNASASYTFKSSKASVASVSSAGVITAKKVGTAKITITRIAANNAKGESKTLTVKVAKAPGSVTIYPATLTIGRGMTDTLLTSLAADYCEVTSSNTDVLTVNCSAKTVTVTADPDLSKYADTRIRDTKVLAYVTLIVKSYNGKTDTTLVTIVDGPQEPSEITVTANRTLFGLKETTGVVTAVANDGMAQFTYSSDNTSAVKVHPTTGALEAVGIGKANITAKATNTGISNSCKIEVVAAPTGISTKTLKLGVSNTYSLMDDPDGIITLEKPAGATAAASGYTYKVTSGSSYISINKTTGVITAKKNGTAKIEITTFNGKSATLTVKVYKLSSTVALSKSSITLGEGMSTTISVKFASSAYSHFTLEISDPDLVSVTSSGVVTAGVLPEGAASGDATITLRTDNGNEASCAVKVLPAPGKDDVIVNPKDTTAITMGVGEKNVGVSLSAPDGMMAEYEYESKSPTDVAVNASTGALTALKQTKSPVTVIARDKNRDRNHREDVSFEFAVTVVPKPKTIELTTSIVTLGVGEVYQIAEVANGGIVKVTSPEKAKASYTYKSGSTSIVTVSSTGLLEAKAKGTATVRIFTQDTNVYKDLTVKVTSGKATGIALNHDKYELYVNGEHPTDTVMLIPELTGSNMNYAGLEFTSNNPEIATVDANGVVTATYDASGAHEGTATITATVTSNTSLKATCEVTVGTLADEVKLVSDDDVTLVVGDVHKVAYEFTPAGTGMRMTYASQNGEIAKVDADGSVTAISGGDTKIGITGQSGTKLSLNVTVLYRPNSITLPIQKLIMRPGDAVTLEYALAYNDIDDVTKLYNETEAASSATAVATVAKAEDVDGYTVTAVGEGIAVITVSTADGLQATCKITVTSDEELLKPRFNWETDPAIMVSDTAEIDFVLTADLFNSSGYAVESSDAGTLEVIDNARIHAIREGSATVTLKVMGENGEFETLDTKTVKVIPKAKAKLWLGDKVVGSAVEMDVSTFTTTYARHELRIDLGASDEYPLLIGTYEVTVEPSLLTIDKSARVLSTTAQTGEAKLKVTTVAGDTMVTVTVVPAPVYRALLISEYNGAGGTSALPFAQNNIDGLQKALEKSNIGGQRYETLEVLRNPSEAQIKSGIATTFKDATKYDVSFIYIVAHGHLNNTTNKMNTNGKSVDYYFSISGTSASSKAYSTTKAETMVTDEELWSWISAIQGKVVLVLSNCHSGAFLEHHKKNGKLAKAGNIAVLTGQIAETNESYYLDYKGIKTHELWSRAVYTALGNPYRAGDEWDDAENADQAAKNSDGYVSVNEMFNYARSLTHSMVAKYSNRAYCSSKNEGFKVPSVTTETLLQKWMKAANGYGQDPQSYIPNSLHDVAIIGY